jgi:hypothetical protein
MKEALIFVAVLAAVVSLAAAFFPSLEWVGGKQSVHHPKMECSKWVVAETRDVRGHVWHTPECAGWTIDGQPAEVIKK